MKYSTGTIAALAIHVANAGNATKAYEDDYFLNNQKVKIDRAVHGFLEFQQDMYHKTKEEKNNENAVVDTTIDSQDNDNKNTDTMMTTSNNLDAFYSTKYDFRQEDYPILHIKKKNKVVVLSTINTKKYVDNNIKHHQEKFVIRNNNDNEKRILQSSKCYEYADCTGFSSEGSLALCYTAGYGYKGSDGVCKALGLCFSNTNCDSSGLLDDISFYTFENCFNTLGGNSIKTKKSGNGAYCKTKQQAGFGGDPHFDLWGGNKKISYQGECDLVMIHNPSFHNDIGIDLHIRTTRVHSYSYIESAAVKIGPNNILQIESTGEYKINGIAGEMYNTTKSSFSGFDFTHWHSGKEFYHLFHIYFDKNNDFGGGKLEFKVFEGIIYVNVDGGIDQLFKGSHGMSGDSDTGVMLGRDGTTIIEDPTDFALEWQVRRDIDTTLFDVARSPQWPEKCLPPHEFVPRLGGGGSTKGSTRSIITRNEAEDACAHIITTSKKDDCIFDVMLTGNKEFGKLEELDQEATIEIAALKEE